MGKKTKKIKWRTLEIPASGKCTENTGSKWNGQCSSTTNNHHLYEKTNIRRKPLSVSSPSDETLDPFSTKQESKGLIEDEYTKITTPRQDVLFKKGYLTRKKVPETMRENSVDHNNDGIAQDCSSNEDFSNYADGDESVQFICPGPQSLIDPSAMYYGGGYEIYDPYMGNVAVIVSSGAGQYATNSSCPPILTSVPCRPVPLQSVQWFNPVQSSDWCPYSSSSDKRCSTDSQNGSRLNSESSVPDSPTETAEMTEEMMNGNDGSILPPSPYIYPGYMFGTPIYNVDNLVTQYYPPESPVLGTSELTTAKRRRKKKRRRRTEAEEESESSFDDNCSRSISSYEFVIDSHLSSESQNDFEELYVKNKPFSAAVPFLSFPRPNVNAPEFVPTTEVSQSKSKSASLYDDNTFDLSNENVHSSDLVKSCHDELSSEKFTQNTSNLNVYCGKAFEGGENKHDMESISGSNNSDSGISSPSSEDTSKGGFCQNEGKNQNDEMKKKPRSRKAGTKTKSNKPAEETKKFNQTVKTISVAAHEETKEVEDLKPCGEEEKEPKKFFAKPISATIKENNKEKRNQVAIVTTNKSDKKMDKKRNVKKSMREGAKINDVVETAEECEKNDNLKDSSFSKIRMHLYDGKRKPILDEEEKNERIEQNNKSGGNSNNNNNNKNNNKINIYDAVKDEPPQTNYISTMKDEYQGSRIDENYVLINDKKSNTALNRGSKLVHEYRYVRVEEKPVLAKLIDPNALENEEENVIKEISSISDFSSCRESSQPKIQTNCLNKKSHYQDVVLTAEQVVNEIIDRAEERMLYSMSCDKLQLPITEAVTKWLNEHGDLLVAETPHDSQINRPNYEHAVQVEKKTKRLKQNCVIC